MIEQVAAFLAQIQTSSARVYKADEVPDDKADRPRHYVVVYDQTPSEQLDTYGATSTTHGYTAAVMHVGTTTNEVLFDAEQTRAALRRVRLSDSATPLKLVDYSPVNPDEQTENLRIYTATDVWRWSDRLA